MVPALRALWKGGWVSWQGPHYQVPDLMLEPHPTEPVPILCGGESEAALRRAARLCDGWVGTAYPLDEAVRYVERLSALRREDGRQDDPFEVIVALMEPPSPDLYRRAEELGITGVMCAPWAGHDDIHTGDHEGLKHPAERYREPIERFAERFIHA
jgi:hypothetical protein